MIGTLTPKSATRAAISGTAVAASPLFTVTLTNCDPARASAATCSAVATASAVLVLVIDCTMTGAEDPTATSPIFVVTVVRRTRKDTLTVLRTGEFKDTSFGDPLDRS